VGRDERRNDAIDVTMRHIVSFELIERNLHARLHGRNEGQNDLILGNPPQTHAD